MKGKVGENLFSRITHQYKSVIEETEVLKSKTKEKMQFSLSTSEAELIRLDKCIICSSSERKICLWDHYLKCGKYRQYIKYLREK